MCIVSCVFSCFFKLVQAVCFSDVEEKIKYLCWSLWLLILSFPGNVLLLYFENTNIFYIMIHVHLYSVLTHNLMYFCTALATPESTKTTASTWLISQVRFVSSLIIHTALHTAAVESNARHLEVCCGTNVSACFKYDTMNKQITLSWPSGKCIPVTLIFQQSTANIKSNKRTNIYKHYCTWATQEQKERKRVIVSFLNSALDSWNFR